MRQILALMLLAMLVLAGAYAHSDTVVVVGQVTAAVGGCTSGITARESDGNNQDRLYASITPFSTPTSGPWTIMFWFKAASTTQSDTYVFEVNEAASPGNQGSIIYEYTGDCIEMYDWNYISEDPRTNSCITISDTNWHHIVYRDAGSGSSNYDKFLDGSKTSIDASYTGTVGHSGYDVFTLMSSVGGGNLTAGSMTEVAIWESTAISDADIASIAGGCRVSDISGITTPDYYWYIEGDASPEPEYSSGTGLTVSGMTKDSSGPF